jgi:hypothetical protein
VGCDAVVFAHTIRTATQGRGEDGLLYILVASLFAMAAFGPQIYALFKGVAIDAGLLPVNATPP